MYAFSLEDFEDKNTWARAISSNQVNYTPTGERMSLRTTASQGEPRSSLTAYGVSDILQGVGVYKPVGAPLDAFQQVASGDLVDILTNEGGVEELLRGRENIAAYDVIARARASTPASINTIVGNATTTNGSGVGTEVQTDASPNGPITTVVVGGIRVNQSIAAQVQALLDAATADGINFGGWGYRSHQRQIELRAAHCADIWTTPANQCSPPTAKPGQSNHESGLAIDFTLNGSTLRTGNPGHVWLTNNAARFGLVQLPSEAWHWSTNGH